MGDLGGLWNMGAGGGLLGGIMGGGSGQSGGGGGFGDVAGGLLGDIIGGIFGGSGGGSYDPPVQPQNHGGASNQQIPPASKDNSMMIMLAVGVGLFMLMKK